MKTLKRSFLAYAILALTITSTSYAQNIAWEKPHGGSGYDPATQIQKTDDGGYIFTGGTNSTNGDVPSGCYHTGTNSPSDVWVVKIDSSGNIQWQK